MSDALQDMIDKQAIIDLTIAYGWLLDHGPRDGLREVFTEDAVANFGGELFEGVDAIIAKVEASLGRLSVSQHIVTNQQVELAGDEASCRCYVHAQHTKRGTEGGDNHVIAGRYEDRVVRTAEGWRIAHRRLSVDWTEGNPAVHRR